MPATVPGQADWSLVRVLVVDDEPVATEAVLSALNKLNISRIRRAADGEAALEIFRQNPDIGLIIADWAMPGADGVSLLQAVRQIKPNVPFFMVTGNATEKHVQQALAAGVDGYIAKPFRPRQLHQKIDRVLTQRYAETQVPGSFKRAFGVER